MIHLSQLSKTYSGTTVLSIEALELQAGEIIGLVGNNGAGKTTFFSLLLDLIKPSTGYIENQGVRVNESEAWKSTTAAFIDENFLIGYLTAEEYFEFIAGLRGVTKAELSDFIEDRHSRRLYRNPGISHLRRALRQSRSTGANAASKTHQNF
jgi:ABC-2 type transport system ATP-binding protein